MLGNWKNLCAPLVLLMIGAVVSAATPPATAPGRGAAPMVEVIPPTPKQYVTDDGHFLAQATVEELDRELSKLEEDTTDQVIVAVYPHMQSGDTLQAYAMRVFNKWRVGQAGKNNGVLILLFSGDRQLQITVGSGIDKVLTDKICKDIVDTQFVPNLKAGNPDKAVTDGVRGIMTVLRPPATAPSAGTAPR